jgi:hypothetical protein
LKPIHWVALHLGVPPGSALVLTLALVALTSLLALGWLLPER